ncbi:MAG TPA: B12-binding domain-containing radical SAM protein [Solirubrobacteraceae bacterium]|nr:B12-binding domain-containing radical SAM protein [Solirubrobacteraceae bacterium]
MSLEDGITSCGFRKMAAYVARLNADTEALYVTTGRYRGIRAALFGLGSGGGLGDDEIDEIAQGLVGADLVGFSSMTGYAELTHRISRRLRELDPSAYQIWGGIHPIIQPEDAITAPVDAICTGEGEFAFEEFYAALSEGRDPTDTKNFWFNEADGSVKRNHFLPLMSTEQMEALPFPLYGEKERIYHQGEGFQPIALGDYVTNDGLSYTTLWSIGCPFHCSYCGNTKFIANDAQYKRIRHPSARYIVDQVNDARRRFPHLSQVSFHDDSFMAITYPQLEEFAELWKAEVDLPFAVYGVIPNYVKQDKFELLTWAGMNRIRMGIQSGSEHILEFYKRPSPPAKIRAAGEVIGNFTPEYHLPPAYDLIVDNPVETRQDVVDTLQLIYDMPRPYTLFIYSLKVIPNTELERLMNERGVELDEIDSSYFVIPPRVGNLLLYVLCLCKPPQWLWRRLLGRVRASTEAQPIYPRIGLILRTLYLAHRALWHFMRMDFSIFPGWTGYVFWRIGAVGTYRRRLAKRHPRPQRPEKWRGGRSGARETGVPTLPVITPARETRP